MSPRALRHESLRRVAEGRPGPHTEGEEMRCPTCNRPVGEDGVNRVHAVFHPRCFAEVRGKELLPPEAIAPRPPQTRWVTPWKRARRAALAGGLGAAAVLALSGCAAETYRSDGYSRHEISFTGSSHMHMHNPACPSIGCRRPDIISTPRQAEPIVARDAGGIPTHIVPAEPTPLDQAPWPEAAPPEAEVSPPGLPQLTPAVPLRLPRIEAAPKVRARGLAMEGGER